MCLALFVIPQPGDHRVELFDGDKPSPVQQFVAIDRVRQFLHVRRQMRCGSRKLAAFGRVTARTAPLATIDEGGRGKILFENTFHYDAPMAVLRQNKTLLRGACYGLRKPLVR